MIGAVHGVAYLSPSPQNSIFYPQFHWRRNNAVKIASWENGTMVQSPNSNYKGRLELFPNATLKISCLQKNDSSVYQVYLEDEKGKERIEKIVLTVYGELGGWVGLSRGPAGGQGGSDTPLPLVDLVPKPVVSAKVIRNDPESCEATLHCSVGLEGVTYKWFPHSKRQLETVDASEHHVSFNPSFETYVCEVSNPVSSNTASLIYRHPCSWIGTARGAPRRRRKLGWDGPRGGGGFGGVPRAAVVTLRTAGPCKAGGGPWVRSGGFLIPPCAAGWWVAGPHLGRGSGVPLPGPGSPQHPPHPGSPSVSR